MFQPLAFEYLLQQASGYGIMRVAVEEGSHLVGKSLSELGTTRAGVLVLSIEREEEVIPVPKARDRIQAGDALVCYGMLANIHDALDLGEPPGETPKEDADKG
jgi:K+/H+ antiporter YhaU regulatory subunit KhtT